MGPEMGDHARAAHDSLLKQPASTVRLPAMTRAVILAVCAARNISFNAAMNAAADLWLLDQASRLAPDTAPSEPSKRIGSAANQPHSRGHQRHPVQVMCDRDTLCVVDRIAATRGHSRLRVVAETLRDALPEFTA
jgi:hypothetical protein